MKSKFPIASPRNAGVKLAVNILNPLRRSPNLMLGTLLTMLSNATLAHALLMVYASLEPIFSSD